MTDYVPKTGDEVLITLPATVDIDGDYHLRDSAIGDCSRSDHWVHGKAVVSVELAPIPLPTDLGAVILAETDDRTAPIRLALSLAPGWARMWIHMESGNGYEPSRITRVHAVLLAGEPS